MRTRTTGRHPVAYSIAALPYAAIVAFYLYVLGVRVAWGYWPYYGHPDAGAFHGPALYFEIVVFILLALAYASVLLIPAFALVSISKRFRGLWRPTALWTVGVLALYLFMWLDPGSFFDWYAD